MAYTDQACKAAPLVEQVEGIKSRPYRLHGSDGEGGLALMVGVREKSWVYSYMFKGKRKSLNLGTYPSVSLAAAREATRDAKAMLKTGRDPAAAKQERKRETAAKLEAERRQASSSFGRVAALWLGGVERRNAAAMRKGEPPELRPATIEGYRRTLTKHVLPTIGHKPIGDIKPKDLLGILRPGGDPIGRGVANIAVSILGNVFTEGQRRGLCDFNAALGLRKLAGVSGNAKIHQKAATKPARVGEILRAIDAYPGHPQTRAALRLLPLVFCRPGKLCGARWDEFDFTARTWSPPSNEVKGAPVFPLARQALEILAELRKLNGWQQYIFPRTRRTGNEKGPTMPSATPRVALKEMGITDHVNHGWRGVFATWAREGGYTKELVEVSLGHGVGGGAYAAYMRGEFLEERRALAQRWADYLDSLRAGSTEPFRKPPFLQGG
jgi:integrase